MKQQSFSFSHTLEVEFPLTPEKDVSGVPCFETREIKCIVDAVYYPPERGLRDSFGVPLEPDYDELIEILGIKGRAGEEIDFDELERTQQEALIEAAYEQLKAGFYEEY